jgi:hypothetical protein
MSTAFCSPWAEVATTIIQSMFGPLLVVGCGRGLPGRGSVTLVSFSLFFLFSFSLISKRPFRLYHRHRCCNSRRLFNEHVQCFTISRSALLLILITSFSLLFGRSIDPILPCAGYRPCYGPSKRCCTLSFIVAFFASRLLSLSFSTFDLRSFFIQDLAVASSGSTPSVSDQH